MSNLHRPGMGENILTGFFKVTTNPSVFIKKDFNVGFFKIVYNQAKIICPFCTKNVNMVNLALLFLRHFIGFVGDVAVVNRR